MIPTYEPTLVPPPPEFPIKWWGFLAMILGLLLLCLLIFLFWRHKRRGYIPSSVPDDLSSPLGGSDDPDGSRSDRLSKTATYSKFNYTTRSRGTNPDANAPKLKRRQRRGGDTFGVLDHDVEMDHFELHDDDDDDDGYDYGQDAVSDEDAPPLPLNATSGNHRQRSLTFSRLALHPGQAYDHVQLFPDAYQYANGGGAHAEGPGDEEAERDEIHSDADEGIALDPSNFSFFVAPENGNDRGAVEVDQLELEEEMMRHRAETLLRDLHSLIPDEDDV